MRPMTQWQKKRRMVWRIESGTHTEPALSLSNHREDSHDP